MVLGASPVYHIYSANLSFYGFLWEKFTLPRWVVGINMTFHRQKNKVPIPFWNLSLFFRIMVRNWCFLSKSDVNVITGGKHIPVWYCCWGQDTIHLYAWLHFADSVPHSNGLAWPLQCGNQGANHGTLPLHWPWPSGECCGKAENTGEYSVGRIRRCNILDLLLTALFKCFFSWLSSILLSNVS